MAKPRIPKEGDIFYIPNFYDNVLMWYRVLGVQRFAGDKTRAMVFFEYIKENYSAKEVITSEALREQSKDYLSPETLKQVIIRMRKQGLLLAVDRGKYIRGDVKE